MHSLDLPHLELPNPAFAPYPLQTCCMMLLSKVSISSGGRVVSGQPDYELAARRSLHRLWSMRTPLGLFGTSLDMTTATWLDNNGGIGASADSFYEYLLKAYVLFGKHFQHTCPTAYSCRQRRCTASGAVSKMEKLA